MLGYFTVKGRFFHYILYDCFRFLRKLSRYINFVTDYLIELTVSRKLFKIVSFFILDFSAMPIISLQVMVTFFFLSSVFLFILLFHLITLVSIFRVMLKNSGDGSPFSESCLYCFF